MKNLAFILAVLFAITSCGLLRKKEVIRNEVYRDSLTIRNEVFVDTLKIKRDVFSGSVDLELLKKIGELTFRGDRTTTKLTYKDGDIGFATVSDSVLQLLLSKVQSLEKYSSSTKVEKPPDVKKSTPVLDKLIILCLILLVIAGIIYIIIQKLKR